MVIRLLFLLSLVLAPICLAEQKDRPPEEWAEELCAVFAKNSGYIARYEGQSKDQRLNATLGTDRAGTSLFVVEFLAGDEGHETRMWTVGDSLFLDSGAPDRRFVANGVRDALTMIEGLAAELSLVPGEDRPGPYTLEPHLFMTKTDLSGYLAAGFSSAPLWQAYVEHASSVKVTKEEVVFQTGGHGEIAISRKTGMMTRQTCPGEDGSKRELVLTGLELDLDAGSLAELRDGWSSEGAQEISFFSHIGLPHTLVFQRLLNQVDRDGVPVERLKKVLHAKGDFLRSYFRMFLPPMDPEEEETWKEYLENAKREKAEELKEKAADEVDKAGVDAWLATPEVRAEVRDALARDLAEDGEEKFSESFRTQCKDWYSPDSDEGKEAFEAMASAVHLAITAGKVEQWMGKFW